MEGTRENIVKKLTEAILKVGDFAADKKNKEQNYDYISADLVLEKGGRALADVGLVVIANILSVEVVEFKREGGKPRFDAKVTFSMTLTDGIAEIVQQWFGFGSDYMTPDKAVYKATTSGHKYYLMKLLQISVGNSDSEHDEPADSDEKKAKVSKKKLSEEAVAMQEEIIKIAKQYGGQANPFLMEIIMKYTEGKGNPNSIKDETVIRLLMAELKDEANVKKLEELAPKAKAPADSQNTK